MQRFKKWAWTKHDSRFTNNHGRYCEYLIPLSDRGFYFHCLNHAKEYRAMAALTEHMDVAKVWASDMIDTAAHVRRTKLSRYKLLP